ncbi:MAG: ArsI/CadI family heavy metal resistance metalloenzyme [Burkholderiaceae bacterium]
MKRFHVHVHVDDLAKSIAFYSQMFGAPPERSEADYAKWMLEDPRLNFAISTRGQRPGLGHLGFQTDTADELATLREAAGKAEMSLLDEGRTTCCYARSDKYWIMDPSGLAWEQFHTLDDIPVFSESAGATGIAAALASGTAAGSSACCTPGFQAGAVSAGGKPQAQPVAASASSAAGPQTPRAGSCCGPKADAMTASDPKSCC